MTGSVRRRSGAAASRARYCIAPDDTARRLPGFSKSSEPARDRASRQRRARSHPQSLPAFLAMATTCSLMALDRSLDFPDLLVTSTALVNMCAPFVVEGARNRRWRDDGKELLVG